MRPIHCVSNPQDSTDNGRIEIVSHGKGNLLIGTVSLMPADNIRGWRADTVALLKQLNSPVYRWPGGNFVSGYDWKDGIGDPDRRPPRKNPAWKGIEHNDVGIHEFMDLCREIDTEAFIAVNTGQGGVQAAAEEIEYVNGGADTPMGKLPRRKWASAAVWSQVVGHRQRNVRRLATGPYAAGRVRQEAQSRRRRDAQG